MVFGWVESVLFSVHVQAADAEFPHLGLDTLEARASIVDVDTGFRFPIVTGPSGADLPLQGAARRGFAFRVMSRVCTGRRGPSRSLPGPARTQAMRRGPRAARGSGRAGGTREPRRGLWRRESCAWFTISAAAPAAGREGPRGPRSSSGCLLAWTTSTVCVINDLGDVKLLLRLPCFRAWHLPLSSTRRSPRSPTRLASGLSPHPQVPDTARLFPPPC